MERKDLPTALRATEEAGQILGRRLTLTIAGDSGSVYSRPSLPSITGVDVEWAGRISDDELEQHYRHADLLLFTSYYEGLGFPCVEALARDIMGAAMPLCVPVVVDVKSGKDWSEV